jgi:hypothetical protein
MGRRCYGGRDARDAVGKATDSRAESVRRMDSRRPAKACAFSRCAPRQERKRGPERKVSRFRVFLRTTEPSQRFQCTVRLTRVETTRLGPSPEVHRSIWRGSKRSAGSHARRRLVGRFKSGARFGNFRRVVEIL